MYETWCQCPQLSAFLDVNRPSNKDWGGNSAISHCEPNLNNSMNETNQNIQKRNTYRFDEVKKIHTPMFISSCKKT
uniref:Ovule protein n=1 Tax=Romanomermis culicivorax TaxID=13658 RepID=A0A915IV47_ROMCU